VAKRRTREQINADKIIRARLMDLGQKIYEQAKERSRVAKDQYYKTDRVEPKGSLRKAGGTLRDSVNYKPITDTVLLLTQVYYGAYQDPNELQVAINEYVDETTDIIVTEITDQLTSAYDS
jgi:hypothetical protein